MIWCDMQLIWLVEKVLKCLRDINQNCWYVGVGFESPPELPSSQIVIYFAQINQPFFAL